MITGKTAAIAFESGIMENGTMQEDCLPAFIIMLKCAMDKRFTAS